MTGLIIKSIYRRTAKLPTLIECDGIPQDREEIPTPEIAKVHPHLRCMADSPKGGPWAEKVALGWTISGQTFLDLVDGPIDV